MSDLVQPLRDLHERFVFQGGSPFAVELADEIERLRERVRWFEASGGVSAHTRVFQEMSRAEQAERERDEAQTRLTGLAGSLKAAGHEDLASVFRVTEERDEAIALLLECRPIVDAWEAGTDEYAFTDLLARVDAFLERKRQ